MTRYRPLTAGLVASSALLLSGCGGSHTPTPPRPAPATLAASPVALTTGCTRHVVPAGYRRDAAHSGRLTAHNYSASADVQAALLFDQLQAGARTVYLHRSGTTVDGVISCVSMRFATAHLADRFFMSYRALRRSAGSLVRRIALSRPVSGLQGVSTYLERGQSFRGYRIAAIDVVEAAGRSGADLDIVSVAGRPPSTELARELLVVMSGGS